MKIIAPRTLLQSMSGLLVLKEYKNHDQEKLDNKSATQQDGKTNEKMKMRPRKKAD